MGLNCSHGAFDGAYSAFNRFRQAVCEATGGSYPPHKDQTLDDKSWYWGDAYSQESHPGLYEFLCHSDCDGEISPEKCVLVANDLEALLPEIEKLPILPTGHIERAGGYIEVAKKFITGCRAASAMNQPLEFA